MNKINKSTAKEIIAANIIPIVFLGISAIGVAYSGVNGSIIMSDVVSRFARNGILVLSLLFPILAGMGLNFGIVVGAMAAQIAMFIVSVLNITGIMGVIAAALITVPFAVFFGWLSALLMNKTKGQEMITSMFIGYFAHGLYMIVFLFILGGVIKIDAPNIMMPRTGVGVRNTIDLAGIKYAIDNLIKTDIFTFALGVGLIGVLWVAYGYFKKKKVKTSTAVLSVLCLVTGVVGQFLPALAMYKRVVKVPVVTFGLIGLLCVFITFFFKTKLGQNMRAVGQNMEIAEVSGINVNKTRTIATIMSVVLAGWGQIIFSQNLGTLSTYSAHSNVGMFASAALLIGGASVTKATVPQAILGTLLFHLLFNVSPMAGKNIFGSAVIGEYFRVFIAYGVIAVAIALHAWKQSVAQNKRNNNM
ncbi:MAG: ABC transporter permease [Oscillospiraceae bacterium]